MRSRFVVIVPLVTAFASFAGCYKEWTFDGNLGDCRDPKDLHYNTSWCLEARCAVDAGYEGCDGGTSESSASSSSSSGLSARCSGTCVNNAPDYFVGPELVYIGPPKAKYLLDAQGYEPCPKGAGSFGARQFNDLNVPSPGCPACVCGEIKGTCAPPTEIFVNASTCDIQPGSSVDFPGPSDWNGLCTNVNALPAGLECPPGSGIPCAQSIRSVPLPAPVQGCEPIPLPVPKATNDFPSWKNMVLSCNANPRLEACDDGSSAKCMPPLPTAEEGWRYCVRRQEKGVFPCTPGSAFSDQVLAYDDFIDTRTCTECTCEVSGGACSGTLRVYKDDTCSTNELVAEGITSEIALCSNLMTSGEAIGSKEITDLMYVPGKCQPIGGQPIGTAVEDETNDQNQTTVTTWCCLAGDNTK